MPRQNRVTPLGDLIAVESRGTLLGNRGILHDAQQRIRRLFNGRRWIYCVLQFKDRRQVVMAPHHYTQLFFLDEATALAAGHRPCAECQRGRYREFQTIWAAANLELAGGGAPGADRMDAVLHAERLGAAKQKRTYEDRLDRLPSGTMVLPSGTEKPHIVLDGRLLPWTPAGYGTPVSRPADAAVGVLTPRSVVRALGAGFRAVVHPSAGIGSLDNTVFPHVK
ncbi:MAG TPA: hypothetical protein VMS17_08920 [Gemmataceae bacterium]|nr:hypothetical protein [Gemmataceae bacterium]